MDLRDKTVIVTGAASGIGKATAFAAGRAGARVIIGDIDDIKGAAAAAEGAASGFRFDYLKLDLTKPNSVDAFADAAQRLASGIDVLVNAAGWDRIQPFLENPPEMWDTVLAINLLGPIRLTRAILRGMIERGGGKIVNVSSDAGRVGSMGETVYAAAKGGVIAFTKSLAREMARYKINVNCVCPGPTDTPLFRQQPEKMQEALTRVIPFKRIGRPEEVADAILFFASARSDYITGQLLSVSGGLTMAG
jgi:2-hydroxycyclohexanecarboxyl-CoA dehydrogenase